MPTDIKDIFRRVLSELDQEEQNELLLQLKDKKLTGKELVDAIRELPPEERAAVREAFIEVAEDHGGREDKNRAKQLEKEAENEEENRGVEDDAGKEKQEEEGQKKRKTRPGRKNGKAYGWYVDEKGRVKVSEVAQVYSGDDEPDEVELYDQDDEEEEEVEEEDG